MKLFSEVTFYKDNVNLSITKLSDISRYATNTAANENNYTLKSRIIAWTDNSAPAAEDFYNCQPEEASAWAYEVETEETARFSGNPGSSFNLVNEFPRYNSNSIYKLYFIVEDRVGNSKIYEIRRGNVTTGINAWMYDVTAPELKVTGTPEKVNNVDGINYFSSNSRVNYTIKDYQSGIKNKGGNNSDETQPAFANRLTEYPDSNGGSLSLSCDEAEYNANTKTLSISGVKDWADNEAESVGFEYSNSTSWVKQNSAPAYSSSPATVTQ